MKYLTVMTFRDQMQRLERYLGKHMRDDQREEYFARLNGAIVDDLFSRAIDRLIDEGKTHFIPLVSEILEAYETERSGIDYHESTFEPCDDCNGTGFFLREDRNGHSWASCCRCAKGQRIRAGWKKRGIDKLIARQDRLFRRRGRSGEQLEPEPEDSFDPSEFEAAGELRPIDPAGALAKIERPNPFDTEDRP